MRHLLSLYLVFNVRNIGLAQPEQTAVLEPLTPDEWANAQAGDRIGAETVGYFLIIQRRLKPKWRAQALAQAISAAQVWLDGATHWAVVMPVDEKR